MKSLKVEHQKPGDGVAEENCGEIIAKERIRVLSHIKEQLQVLCAEEEEKKVFRNIEDNSGQLMPLTCRVYFVLFQAEM